MGIRKKMRRQFYFDLWQRSDTTALRRQSFRQKFVISSSVSTMQRCIINKISKDKHLT